MRLYFGFNLQTHTLLCHEMAKQILQHEPEARFAGVMSVKDGAHERFLKKQTDVPYELLDTTDEIEKRALSYEVSAGRIAEWERRLSCPLMDLVIADRDLGHRYVAGGELIRTDMMAHDRHEDLQRVVCCFLDTYEERLSRFKPDLVFIVCIAALPTLALARVCECMGIRYVVLRSARIGDRFVLSLNGATERFYQVEQAFETACAQGGPLPQLPPEFQRYLDSYQTDRPEAPVWAAACSRSIEKLQKANPFRFYGELGLRFALACKRKLMPPKNRDLRWKHPFSIFRFHLKQKLAVRHFRPKRFDEPRDGEAYIYFPLHLTPEAATMVLSPAFTDQNALIDLLASRIPLTHKLYVKEHPTMIGRRPRGFYERIRRHANVRLLNPLFDSMTLTRRADLLASITGTAAWEAILMGRPVSDVRRKLFLAPRLLSPRRRSGGAGPAHQGDSF
jgi:hypothetical protein